MKKAFLLALTAVVMGSCGEQRPAGGGESGASDSIEALMRENEQLRGEQDDLLATLNEIEDGFREINEAQGRLTIDRRGEGEDARERIREDMQYIQQTLAQNRELIEKLRAQAKASSRQSEQLRHTIENLTAQMEQKNSEIAQLREELEAKNIRIGELDEEVANLSQDISDLKEQNQQQDQTINQQDRKLNTAWYVVGSKRELKDHNILQGGKVLQEGFDASYFTEIDIRSMSTINLNTKKADILTSHPASSYTLEQGAGGMLTLRISNAQQFWSTSKYLVVQSK